MRRMSTRTLLLLALGSTLSCAETPPPEAAGDDAPVEAEKAPEAKSFDLEAYVKSSLDTQADPCTDFYQYACGGWLASTELPADKPRLTRSFTTIQDSNEEVLKGILEAAGASDDAATKKIGDMYAACMDEEAVNAAGAKPIEPLLAEIAALSDLDAVMTWAAKASLMQADVFFGTGISPDAKNPKLNIIEVGQGGLGLPDRDYYLKDDAESVQLKADYQAHIAKMLELTGRPAEEAAASAAAIVAFETELAKSHLQRAELRDPQLTYNKLDREGLEKLAPNLPWGTFFTAMGLGDKTQINVGTPKAFEHLNTALPATDLAVLKDYLSWHLINAGAAYLSSDLDTADFEFYKKRLRGQQAQQPRWKRCVAVVDHGLGHDLAKAYVSQAFAGDSKTIALDMIKSIEASFESNLPNLEWMDDETRGKAVEKAHAITNKIGYPDSWRTYEDVTVTGSDHFTNVMNASMANSTYQVSQAEKPVDPDHWYMTPPTVNAYYNPVANEIVFPAGIMQAPFFDKDMPMAFNYGAMGMVMGHELSHGFDDSGRQFSPTGVLEEWWNADVSEKFETRAQCVVDQYSKYEVSGGLKVNGQLTLGENIADLGGLKQAYGAYQDWVATNGAEPELAGLSPNQQLFVAFAQGWCTIASPEYEAVQVNTDPHSPARARVNGPLVNTPAFAEAFQCAEGTPMNPTSKCEVW